MKVHVHGVSVTLDNTPILGDAHLVAESARQAGRSVAVVTQDHDLDNDFSVEETVAMGRLPHKRLLERDNQTDHDIIRDALSRVPCTTWTTPPPTATTWCSSTTAESSQQATRRRSSVPTASPRSSACAARSCRTR